MGWALGQPVDVLYRLRVGERNDELRYSLRSLVNIEGGLGRVYVVGHCPRWLTGVEHIPGSERPRKWQQGIDHLAIATRELSGRRVLLIDDDMYLLRPWRPIVLRAPGSLLDYAMSKAGSYQRSLLATDAWLRSRGIPEPVSYELHVPLPIDCDAAAPMLADALAAPGRIPLQGRSVYGNLARLGGVEQWDVKVKAGEAAALGLASSNTGELNGWRSMLARLFPEPSSFER